MGSTNKPAMAGQQRYLAAVGVCTLTVLLTLPLHGLIALANIVLVFVLAVAIIAALWGRGPGVFASFLAVACFNFFFVAPRFSFSVDDAEYLLTFSVMLVVSLLISHLSNAYRDKAVEAERRAGEARLLQALAQSLSSALSNERVAELAYGFMLERLGVQGSLFVAGSDEHLHALGRPAVNLVEKTAVQGVYAHGSSTGAVAGLHEGVATLLLPLEGATRRRGVLAVYVGVADERPESTLLAAIAALLATAVERIHFVEVAQASELESQSERLRSSILSSISHDIRTPLTVLFGLADTLAASKDMPIAQRETAESLRDQTQRLHRMVDNLLDMARLKSGRVSLRTDWQSIPEIVAASVLSLDTALSRRTLQLDWPDDLPLIKLDALLMERVFSNLLENAIKYSPEASVIEMGAKAEGEFLSVWVDNGGAGFPLERLPQVFGLFERGEAESSIPGVGLGLSICRTIVEAHGGRISAWNTEQGARVSLLLPCTIAPAIPEESEVGHG